MARFVAFSPAWSPSKHKTTDDTYRSNIFAWFGVKAVPNAATTFFIPY